MEDRSMWYYRGTYLASSIFTVRNRDIQVEENCATIAAKKADSI